MTKSHHSVSIHNLVIYDIIWHYRNFFLKQNITYSVHWKATSDVIWSKHSCRNLRMSSKMSFLTFWTQGIRHKVTIHLLLFRVHQSWICCFELKHSEQVTFKRAHKTSFKSLLFQRIFKLHISKSILFVSLYTNIRLLYIFFSRVFIICFSIFWKQRTVHVYWSSMVHILWNFYLVDWDRQEKIASLWEHSRGISFTNKNSIVSTLSLSSLLKRVKIM